MRRELWWIVISLLVMWLPRSVSLRSFVASSLRADVQRQQTMTSFGSVTNIREFSSNTNKQSARQRLQQSYDDEAIKNITENWVRKWVFRLGLCPWSGKVLVDNRMKLMVQRGHSLHDEDLQHIADTVLLECQVLSGKQQNSSSKSTTNDGIAANVETILVILPDMQDFDDYLNLHDFLENSLAELGLDEDVQIATFHPKYQFANTKPSDVENYTNRSPFAMFHLLKVQQVSDAIDSVQGDTEAVWRHNVDTMKSLGAKKVKEMQQEIIEEATSKR